MEVDHNRLYLIVGGENLDSFHDWKNNSTKHNGKANCIAVTTSKEAYGNRTDELLNIKCKIYPLTKELFAALTLLFPPLDKTKIFDFEPRRVAVAKFLEEWNKT